MAIGVHTLCVEVGRLTSQLSVSRSLALGALARLVWACVAVGDGSTGLGHSPHRLTVPFVARWPFTGQSV